MPAASASGENIGGLEVWVEGSSLKMGARSVSTASIRSRRAGECPAAGIIPPRAMAAARSRSGVF